MKILTMNKIYRSFIPAALSLCIMSGLTTSCIEEYNAVLPSSESDILVVEGSILSDTTSTFYLSLTMPINSPSYKVKNISDATIQLRGTDGTTVDGKLIYEGKYDIETPKLNANTLYKVVINYDGDTYETEEMKPFPSTDIQTVEFNQKTPEDAVDILVTTAIPTNPSETQYYRWTYNETYEVRPEYISYWTWADDSAKVKYNINLYPRRGWISSKGSDILASSSAYYGNNQIVQYKLYDIANNNRRLSVKYSTEVVQRSICKAEYEYEKERKKISTDMGGLFTPQPSSLPTNIHCSNSSKKVLGYVGCSLNVKRYRIFITTDQVNYVDEVKCIDKYTEGENQHYMEHINHVNGYKIWLYENNGGIESFHWTTPDCVDVRVMGATTNKPDYWE